MKGVYLIIFVIRYRSNGINRKGTSKTYSSSKPGVCMIPHYIVSYLNFKKTVYNTSTPKPLDTCTYVANNMHIRNVRV